MTLEKQKVTIVVKADPVKLPSATFEELLARTEPYKRFGETMIASARAIAPVVCLAADEINVSLMAFAHAYRDPMHDAMDQLRRAIKYLGVIEPDPPTVKINRKHNGRLRPRREINQIRRSQRRY